jgi:hypothetical protein
MLIYVKNMKKKNFLRTDRRTDRRTDNPKLQFGTSQKKSFFIGQTDGRSTQSYSSEPHIKKVFLSDRQTDVQLKAIVRNLTKKLFTDRQTDNPKL